MCPLPLIRLGKLEPASERGAELPRCPGHTPLDPYPPLRQSHRRCSPVGEAAGPVRLILPPGVLFSSFPAAGAGDPRLPGERHQPPALGVKPRHARPGHLQARARQLTPQACRRTVMSVSSARVSWSRRLLAAAMGTATLTSVATQLPASAAATTSGARPAAAVARPAAVSSLGVRAVHLASQQRGRPFVYGAAGPAAGRPGGQLERRARIR